MDLMDLLKLAGIDIQAQPMSNEPSCGCGMEESEGAGFDDATTEPNPEEFPDGISTLGSVSDTSLRRYLKARGDHVTVDEDIYPDYAVEDIAESYKAFAEKAKNPYAVGMAQAMKSTGDEPPLKKSTIKKAHDIAKAVNEGSSNIGDTYMKHLHTKYNDKKSLSKSEAKEVKDMMTKHTISDVKKLAGSGIRHVSDAAKDHIKRYVPGNMKKESLELDEAAKPDYIDIDKDGNKTEPMKKAAKDKEKVSEAESNKFGVFKSGGSVGEKNTGKPIKTFATKEEAEDYAKRMNQQLSKGEKEHYKLSYKTKAISEEAKPDYIDIDGDGDKKEPMKKAAKDKEETKANESLNYLKKLAGVA